MTASASQPTSRSDYDAVDAVEVPYLDDELLAGERVGPPLARRGRKALLWGAVAALSALAAGWLLLTDEAAWRGWLEHAIAAASSSIQGGAPRSVERAGSAVVAPAPSKPELPAKLTGIETPPSLLQPMAPSKDVPASDATPSRAAPPSLIASVPPQEKAPESEPLPPARADPADPYQVRAEAAGLHPELSRVLLAKLSPGDFHNARIAIDTALSKTPDDDVLVWPRQRKPEQALFQVRFVQGAAPGCRRYVVSVTKDGWLTTALPMERCGLAAPQARRP